MELNGRVIWLRINSHLFDESVKDAAAGSNPVLWRGNYVQFQLGVFFEETLVDLSNVASLTLEVFANTRVGDPFMTKSIGPGDITPVITRAGWDNRTESHASVEFTGLRTNLDVDASSHKRTYWLAVSVVTNHEPGHKITYGAGSFTIIEDGPDNADYTPPASPDNFYNMGQADARFMQIWPDGSGVRFKDHLWQWYFPTEGKWRALIPGIVDNQPTHAWGDPED